MRKIKIDHQYIAYLLLEMLYKEGKVNKDTYDAVMAEKERYLRMVKAGENNPSKYRISKPSEILDELDLNASHIFELIKGAQTPQIDDREIFMKGIDYSYYYEEVDA